MCSFVSASLQDLLLSCDLHSPLRALQRMKVRSKISPHEICLSAYVAIRSILTGFKRMSLWSGFNDTLAKVIKSFTIFPKISRPRWTKMSEISLNIVENIDEDTQKSLLITCTTKLHNIIWSTYIFSIFTKKISWNSTPPPFGNPPFINPLLLTPFY